MRELEELQKMGLVATSKTASLLERMKRSFLSQQAFAFPLATGCCALEISQAARQGAVILPQPTQGAREEESDLFIVSGHINFKWAPMLKKAYEKMGHPKWVMAVGTCASSGAVFEGAQSLPGLNSIIPVDVYVPGCPPSPDEIVHGLEELKRRISLGIEPKAKVAL